MKWIITALCWGLAGLGMGLAIQRNQDNFLARWCQPVGALISGIQWVRADLALREGESWRAYERAEDALFWAKDDPQVWIFYAHSLLFHETAAGRELSPEQREAYARAGLGVLERARQAVPAPAELWIYEGAVYAGWASLETPLRPLRIGEDEAWEQAARCFEAAQRLGHPQAGALLQAAREHFSPSGASGR
jgi:hypothetical protein